METATDFEGQNWQVEISDLLNRSKLYRRLTEIASSDTSGDGSLMLVREVCFYAYQRSKLVVRYMGEYTLHDVDHLRKVLILMEKLIPAETIEKLAIPELMLLICSAFFHDIGMAPSQEEFESFEVFWDTNPETRKKLSPDFKKFCAGHVEITDKIIKLTAEGKHSQAGLLKKHLMSEFIRSTHAQRAANIIAEDWNRRFKYKDSDLTNEFAQICFSHANDTIGLLEMDSSFLCGDGVYVCMPFIGVILRLADLIDFDAKRTPDVLYQHLSIKNPISLQEWQKHRSVDAWDISPNVIRFSVRCEHPAIEFAVRQFCDSIDKELSLCSLVITRLSDSIRNPFPTHYKIALPPQVERSKIGPVRNPATNKPLYSYHETKFNLNKRQVIELLMGTRLYGNPETALRELVQNSIDACLLRDAMEKSWGTTTYTPQVEIRFSKEGFDDILEVNDNGTGMDLHIINKFYSKVGTSFYNSTEFYELRSGINLIAAPISRFGIGVLSCFMVSDDLKVCTKRLKGNYESSESLEVTVEGYESIYYIKDGSKSAPGTDTKLVLRETHPWRGHQPAVILQFIKRMIPAPPFPIKVSILGEQYIHSGSEFKTLPLKSYPEFGWASDSSIKEYFIDVNDPEFGITGRVIVAVLEKDGLPERNISVLAKQIKVENQDRLFSKNLQLNDNSIYMNSVGLIPDNAGNLTQHNSGYTFLSSKGIISLHGIEIPMNPFPDYFTGVTQKAKLIWPLPVLFVVDVWGKNDLDLNSARTEILPTEKWFAFEELFAFNLLNGLKKVVSTSYFSKLLQDMTAPNKSAGFKAALEHFN